MSAAKMCMLSDMKTLIVESGTDLLTPQEVAQLFRVDPKTVTRWAKAGRLMSIRTLGGHRRFMAAEVHELLNKTTRS